MSDRPLSGGLAIRPVFSVLFLASGFSAVTYQVVLSRYLQLIVGSTAYAISALLVAFMLGMSAGSLVGGRWTDRSSRPLRLYALAEGAVGLYCLAFPALYPFLQDFYLHVAPPIEGPTEPRNLVRFILGVAAFIVPSFFMGMTTPAYTKALTAGRADMGRRIARLYALNVLGAAAGAFLTAYVLVPQLGLVGAIAVGAVTNFAVCVLAWRLSDVTAPEDLANNPSSALGNDGESPPTKAVDLTRITLMFVAVSSGILSFALEVIWTHLLAILIGNSIYAFGLMLGSLLLGLALGARIAEVFARTEQGAHLAIGASQILAGTMVIATLGVWDRIPALFLLLARSSPSFGLMEVVRFAVAFLLMVLPTAFMGMAFPLVMRCAGSEASSFGRSVGGAYAANTLGAVAGAILGSYGLLPQLGSLSSLRSLGVALLVVGTACALALSSGRRRLTIAGAGLALIAFGSWVPVTWNFNALNVASAIYLGRSTSSEGRILFQSEDATGGLTTVVESRGVRTLLTNGKFQGDDSEEVPIQHRLANIPTLFTSGRERALVIGLGTGVTLASVAAHGFEKTVCAELSLPIIDAAKAEFLAVNGRILDSPSVELIRDDGRSVLRERTDRYDAISVEVNSIWFAGTGMIYSDEFYRLASKRLKRNGVLLQWFPVHHLSPANLFLVVNTMRSVFPYVSVWNHRHQGFVVASNEPLNVDLASIRADLERPSMTPYLRELRSGSPLELLGDLVVSDSDSDRFLDSMAELLFASRRMLSTDTRPTLEYETPKDILDNFLFFQNRAIFRRFRSSEPFPFRGEPTDSERQLAQTAFVHGWLDPRALGRIAQAWRSQNGGSGVASRWLLDELSGDDLQGGGYSTDPVAELRTALPVLSRMVSAVASESECRPAPAFVTEPRSLRLRLAGAFGQSLDGTLPAATLDDRASPSWDPGWRVRPDAAPPRLEVAIDPPAFLTTLHVVVRPIDGSVVRTRVLGKSASGRWQPLASGGLNEELGCREMRVLHLPSTTEPLVALRLEFQGEGFSSRIAVHEVWAVERD